MALLGNGYRTASIRCLTDSYFGVLDLQSFTDILLEIEERKILLNLNYLHKVDLFKDWNDKDLKIIFFNSVEVNYRYQDVVYKYGSNSDFIYIIKKGRFEVIKALPTYARATLRAAFPTHSDATLGLPSQLYKMATRRVAPALFGMQPSRAGIYKY